MSIYWCHLFRWYYTILISVFHFTYTVRAENGTCPQGSTTTVQQLDGWDYQGCFRDQLQNRLLTGPSRITLQSKYETVAACAEFCSSNGEMIFGVEDGWQCYCDNSLRPTEDTYQADSSFCNSPCCSDTSVSCGGVWYLNVYRATNYSATQPANATQSGSSRYNTSEKIDLGMGISFGVPMFLLAAITLALKCYKKGHVDNNGVQVQPASGDSLAQWQPSGRAELE